MRRKNGPTTESSCVRSTTKIDPRKARIKQSRRENRRRQRHGKKALPSVPNWWWTPAHAMTACHSCREQVPERARIAYDSHAKTVLCEICADSQGVSAECRESRKMRA
jgi:hypothetical protein